MFLVQTLGGTGCLGKAWPSSDVQPGGCCQALQVPRCPPVPADVSLSLPGMQGSLSLSAHPWSAPPFIRFASWPDTLLTPRPPERAVSPLFPDPCARSSPIGVPSPQWWVFSLSAEFCCQ